MKYWLYLAAKLVVAAIIVLGLQTALGLLYPEPPPPSLRFVPPPPPVLHDMQVDRSVPTLPNSRYLHTPSQVPLFREEDRVLLPDDAFCAFTLAILGIWLVGAGLFSLIVWDQRRRCRACLRRLIMPVYSGSWGNMVTYGRPKTELICPFGHGTLSIEELQITGRQTPDWQPHDDNIWKELESYYQVRK